MNSTVQDRRDRLRSCLGTEDVDGLLIISNANVGYLTGFSGDSSLLVLTTSRDVLVSDGRYSEQLAEECPDLETCIRPVSGQLIPTTADAIAKLGVRRLGFEAEHLTVSDFELLKAALPAGTEHKPVSGRVEALRAVKDDGEIAAIREAVAFAERAYMMLRDSLSPEHTESDVADALEANLRRCGATAASFPPIVAVGANAAKPHARPTNQARLRDADFVLIDWGATGRPYKSDLTRVVATGKVTSEFRTIYECVLRAQQLAIALIRPGAKTGDVDAVARQAINAAGFGNRFDHGLGHGIGMEIHEAPRFRPNAEELLRPGMVVTVEPGIYIPGWGGVRIEDDVLVTADGYELLSHLPRDLESASLNL